VYGDDNGGGGRSVRFKIVDSIFSYLLVSVFNLHSPPTCRAGEIKNKPYRKLTGLHKRLYGAVQEAVKPYVLYGYSADPYSIFSDFDFTPEIELYVSVRE
jgi:hypothetical protein